MGLHPGGRNLREDDPEARRPACSKLSPLGGGGKSSDTAGRGGQHLPTGTFLVHHVSRRVTNKRAGVALHSETKRMKRLFLMATLALTPVWMAACGGDDEDSNPIGDGDGDGDGDMPGDGDGDTPGDGDGDMPGDGDGDSPLPECSDDEFTLGGGGAGGAGAGGAGGAGGSPAAACGVTQTPDVEIEIVGSFTDQYDSSIEVKSDEILLGDAVYTLSIVDNEENYAVALNSADNEWNPCTWSTFVWHETEDGLYYCQSPYAATTECGALEADRPDPDDLDAGCGGFSWSQLTEN